MGEHLLFEALAASIKICLQALSNCYKNETHGGWNFCNSVLSDSQVQ